MVGGQDTSGVALQRWLAGSRVEIAHGGGPGSGVGGMGQARGTTAGTRGRGTGAVRTGRSVREGRAGEEGAARSTARMEGVEAGTAGDWTGVEGRTGWAAAGTQGAGPGTAALLRDVAGPADLRTAQLVPYKPAPPQRLPYLGGK